MQVQEPENQLALGIRKQYCINIQVTFHIICTFTFPLPFRFNIVSVIYCLCITYSLLGRGGALVGFPNAGWLRLTGSRAGLVLPGMTCWGSPVLCRKMHPRRICTPSSRELFQQLRRYTLQWHQSHVTHEGPPYGHTTTHSFVFIGKLFQQLPREGRHTPRDDM